MSDLTVTEKPQHKKAGPKTKYRPEFVEQVVPFMAQGFSIVALAGHLGVARSCVYRWMDEHEDFAEAVKTGAAAAALFWENCLRQLAATGQGNATAVVFALKNRCPKDWRDRKEIDHASTDGTMSPQRVIIEAAPVDDENSDDPATT